MKGILTPPTQNTSLTQTDYKELYHRVHSWSYTQNMRQAAKNKDQTRLDELALELLQEDPDTVPYVAAKSPQNAFLGTTEPVLNNSNY